MTDPPHGIVRLTGGTELVDLRDYRAVERKLDHAMRQDEWQFALVKKAQEHIDQLVAQLAKTKKDRDEFESLLAEKWAVVFQEAMRESLDDEVKKYIKGLKEHIRIRYNAEMEGWGPLVREVWIAESRKILGILEAPP